MTEATGTSDASWSPLQQRIFLDRYARKGADDVAQESQPEEMWRRVATAIAAVKPTTEQRRLWAERFYEAMTGFTFVPGGRILAGAGTGHAVTYYDFDNPERAQAQFR